MDIVIDIGHERMKGIIADQTEQDESLFDNPGIMDEFLVALEIQCREALQPLFAQRLCELKCTNRSAFWDTVHQYGSMHDEPWYCVASWDIRTVTKLNEVRKSLSQVWCKLVPTYFGYDIQKKYCNALKEFDTVTNRSSQLEK